MNAAWETDATLADTTDVGFYRYVPPSGRESIFRVRWNRALTGRYAEQLLVGDGRAKWHYTPGVLPSLRSSGQLTVAQVLRWLGDRGPYTACLCCGHPLREAPYTAFGVGPTCIEKLGATPKLVATLYRALRISSLPGPAPAAGPGTRRRHLRLVAVDGKRIA